jgi:hypothetical protein
MTDEPRSELPDSDPAAKHYEPPHVEDIPAMDGATVATSGPAQTDISDAHT